MFGQKILQFDNSDGTLKTFNTIFNHTPIDGDPDTPVEILSIHEPENRFGSNPFVRNVLVGDTIIKLNFGEDNFTDYEDILLPDRIRFKYYAYNLRGRLVATAYNCGELAKKLGCSQETIKKRLVNKITSSNDAVFKYNIKRKEI